MSTPFVTTVSGLAGVLFVSTATPILVTLADRRNQETPLARVPLCCTCLVPDDGSEATQGVTGVDGAIEVLQRQFEVRRFVPGRAERLVTGDPKACVVVALYDRGTQIGALASLDAATSVDESMARVINTMIKQGAGEAAAYEVRVTGGLADLSQPLVARVGRFFSVVRPVDSLRIDSLEPWSIRAKQPVAAWSLELVDGSLTNVSLLTSAIVSLKVRNAYVSSLLVRPPAGTHQLIGSANGQGLPNLEETFIPVH